MTNLRHILNSPDRVLGSSRAASQPHPPGGTASGSVVQEQAGAYVPGTPPRPANQTSRHMLLQQASALPAADSATQRHKRMTSVDVRTLHDQSGAQSQRLRRSSASSSSLSEPSTPSKSVAPAVANALTTSTRETVAPVEEISAASTTSGNVSVRLATLDDNEAVNKFLMDLDDETFADRFGSVPRDYLHDFLKTDTDFFAVFIALKEGRVVGLYDCAIADRYDPRTVCMVNIVVDANWHGKGVAKALTSAGDECLRAAGFRHKTGLVYADNEVQIQRLSTAGWNVIPVGDDSVDDAVEVWTALDPRYKDEKPKLNEAGQSYSDEFERIMQRIRQISNA